MSRETYVWNPETRKLIPKHEAAFLKANPQFNGVMPDIRDFVTTDGVHIHGRSGLREYQRRTGLEQIGDTVNGLDEKGQYRRIVQEMPPISRDIREALEKVSQGYKPREE